MTIRRYYLGCPVWHRPEWAGLLYTRDAGPADFLRQYSRVFNTVEGNTTFHAVPRADVADSWGRRTPTAFRFCFKFPRRVSHELGLARGTGAALDFLSVMSPLGDRLGPFFLQLPPAVGPSSLAALTRFLRALPPSFAYAVEVRAPGFFATAAADELDDMLASLGVNRVVYDARGLRAAAPTTPAVAEAQRRLARVPVHITATGGHPLVRIMAHPDPNANRLLFAEWARVLSTWIGERRAPHVFVHTVDDRLSPLLARELHAALAAQTNVGEVPPFPASLELGKPEQLPLLDEGPPGAPRRAT